MFKITSQSKLIIISLLLLTAIALSSVAIYQEYEKQAEIAGLDEGLKLKAPVENIIRYAEYDENGRPLPAPTSEMNGNLIKYVYRTNIVVPADNYKGLKEDLSQRTPNAQIFLKSEKEIAPDKIEKTYVGKFYSGVNFSKSGDKWYQTEVGATTKSAFLKQIRPTLLTKAKKLLGQPVFADTYYSGAGDGYVVSSASDRHVWADAHDGTSGGGSVDFVSTTTIAMVTEGNPHPSYYIYRTFLPFDTSAIPSSAIINSAILKIYVVDKSDQDIDGNDYIGLVQSTQTSSTILTTADYVLCGALSSPTQGATALNIASDITMSTYNSFVLDATGITWIAKNGAASVCGTNIGTTCLGLREGHDIANSAITLGGINSITISTSEESGTSNDPYLDITYTVPVPTIKVNGGTVKVNGGTVKVNGAAP